jgi:hypothetical protein
MLSICTNLERYGLKLTQANKSQLIEFACHLGGHSSQLYSREYALGSLRITSNFTKNWTRDQAIEAITSAFDWVETGASTPSTPSDPCSASRAMSLPRPMPSFTPQNHETLHLVGLGANRISTVRITGARSVIHFP